ncbi:hypothetical protein ACFWUP_08285 [Nocardia sp. NPDC058658]|uniref:hypothetical protein n=1 Tax=Nocardia sp. NPDC058658 TaxID=3346580 RepID=UPI003652E051
MGGAVPGVNTFLMLREYANGSKPIRSMDESPDAQIARKRLEDLKSEFDGAYQGSKVHTYEEPSGLSDLYERVSAMSMADVNSLHTRWETLRNKLEEGFKTYDSKIAAAIAEKWVGDAGASAGAGIKEYVDKSSNLLTSAQMMAEKVKVVESAMQIAKDRVKPHEGSTISGIASYIPGPTWKMDSHNADTAKSEGAEVIRGIYYTAIEIADTKVPLVPQPYNPLETGAKPGEDKGDDGNTGTKPTTQQPTTQQPTTQQPTTEQPTTETPTTEDPSDDDTGDDTTPSSTEPAATTPQSAVPTTPTSPAGTTPAGTTPMGTGGSPGAGSPGGGTPGSAVPGASVPGTPGGAAAGKGGAAAGGAGSGGAGRGMAGMGGMGAGGGRGKGDDEKESGTKDYLINIENGEELTGLSEDQRAKTVPPVIGE